MLCVLVLFADCKTLYAHSSSLILSFHLYNIEPKTVHNDVLQDRCNAVTAVLIRVRIMPSVRLRKHNLGEQTASVRQ